MALAYWADLQIQQENNMSNDQGIKQLIKSINEMVEEAGTGKKKLSAWRDPKPNTFGPGEHYWVEKDITKERREYLFASAKQHIDDLQNRVFSAGPTFKRAELTKEEEDAIRRDVIIPEIESHKLAGKSSFEGSAVERLRDYAESKSCCVSITPDGDAAQIIADCMASKCSGGEVDEYAAKAILADEKRNAEFAKRRAEKETGSLTTMGQTTITVKQATELLIEAAKVIENAVKD